jgi:hypothetical protein
MDWQQQQQAQTQQQQQRHQAEDEEDPWVSLLPRSASALPLVL